MAEVSVPRDLLDDVNGVLQGDFFDLSGCAYYRRYMSALFPDADPEGICSYGCRDEPSCQTEEPSEGWPAVRLLHFLNELDSAESDTSANGGEANARPDTQWPDRSADA